MNLEKFTLALDLQLDGPVNDDTEVTISQLRKALGHTNTRRDPVAWARRYDVALSRVVKVGDWDIAFTRREHALRRFKDGAFRSSLARSKAQADRYDREARAIEAAIRESNRLPVVAPSGVPIGWETKDGRAKIASQRFEALQTALRMQEAELVALSAKIDFLVAKVGALCKAWDVPVSREDKIF